MNKDSKLIAIAIVAVLCVAAVAAYATYLTDDSKTEEADIVGYWHQVYYSGYRDGVYACSDDEPYNVYEYDIQVDECRDGVFNGVYCGVAMSGAYTDGKIMFAGVYGDHKVFLEGKVSDGRIYASTTDRSDGSVRVFYCIYSMDPEDKPTQGKSTDISGNWLSYDAESVTKNGVSELSGNEFIVSEQKGHSFIGTMQQQVGAEIVSVDIAGAFTDSRTDGYLIGYMAAKDVNWIVYTDGRSVFLRVTLIGETDETKDLISSVNRSYTRDGTPADENVMDLAGQTWHMKTSSQATPANDTSSSYIERWYTNYSITFTEQYGPHVIGKATYGLTDYAFAGTVCGSNIDIMFDYDTMTYAFASISDDTLCLREFDFSESYGNIACVSYFTKDTGICENPIGHWYSLMDYGMLDDGTFVLQTNGGADRSHLYGLEILSFDNNLFHGTFGGYQMAGTYYSGTMSFSVGMADGVIVSFTGTMSNDRVLDSVEVYTHPDGKIDIWQGVYSLDNIRGSKILEGRGVAGNWTSPDGYSFVYDGEVKELVGKKMTLEYHNNFLTGTMEQQVNEVLVEKDVKGVLYMNTNDEIAGLIIDDTGIRYTITMYEGTLFLSSVDPDDSESALKMTACERIYTKDGSTPETPEATPVLKGTTWKSGPCHAITQNGARVVLNDPMTITITDQYKNTFVGTMSDSDSSYKIYGCILPDLNGTVMISDEDGEIMTAYIIDGEMHMLSSSTLDSGNISMGVSYVYEKISE